MHHRTIKTTGRWCRVSLNSKAAHQFLATHEWRLLAISDWVMRHRRNNIVNIGLRLQSKLCILNSPNGSVAAILLYTPEGIIYTLGCGVNSPIPRLLPARVAVMGLEDDVMSVANTLAGRRYRSMGNNHYRVYTHRNSAYVSAHPTTRAPIPLGVKVRQATKGDTDQLVTLHAAYLHEEVYEQRVPRGFVIAEVEKMMRDQVVIVACYHNRIIAKAATNGSGIHYKQIGGVYTHPQFRNHHIANHMLRLLMAQIAPSAVCLFVKEENWIAQALYCSLGFRPRHALVFSRFGRSPGTHAPTIHGW